jgi:hypothetical protein
MIYDRAMVLAPFHDVLYGEAAQHLTSETTGGTGAAFSLSRGEGE